MGIHARIELRPDGSQNRSSFIKMHSAIGKQHFDPTFKSGRDSILAPANLHRSDSIRERREVPPPKRESNSHREQPSSSSSTTRQPTSGRIGLDRSVSLRKDPEERKKIAKKVQ